MILADILILESQLPTGVGAARSAHGTSSGRGQRPSRTGRSPVSVWIRHVQSDRQQTTEYYENLGRQRSAGAAPAPVDQQLEIDGAPLDLAEIELVVIEIG